MMSRTSCAPTDLMTSRPRLALKYGQTTQTAPPMRLTTAAARNGPSVAACEALISQFPRTERAPSTPCRSDAVSSTRPRASSWSLNDKGPKTHSMEKLMSMLKKWSLRRTQIRRRREPCLDAASSPRRASSRGVEETATRRGAC